MNIIELAREAGMQLGDNFADKMMVAVLTRFAHLVRDAYREELLAGVDVPWTYTETSPAKPLYNADQMAAAVLRERERCAKLCESLPMQQEIDVRDQCAAAIRGETK